MKVGQTELFRGVVFVKILRVSRVGPREAFDGAEFHRLYGRCDVRNDSLWALMSRLQMRREAHLVNNEIFKGEWGDEFVYAILAREWHDDRDSRGG
jgi:RimJ/RimL family protein N-acetyltransferase